MKLWIIEIDKFYKKWQMSSLFNVQFKTIIQMQRAVDQLSTLHQYISCIFDNIAPLQIEDLTSDNTEKSCIKLIDLAQSYGKLIMKLSDQSTLKYRKDNFLNRREVEQEIAIIYRIIVGQETEASYDTSIRIIIEKLQQQRKSNYIKQSLPESRVLDSALKKSAIKHLGNVQQQRNSNSRPSSRVQTKAKKPNSVKQILQIRAHVESQQNNFKHFFEKVNAMLEQSKIMTNTLSSETLHFSKSGDENNSENIVNFIEVNSHNFNKNIDKLSKLTQLIYNTLQKRIKNQGLAQTKLNLVLNQIKQMEEIYSYTLSKMLEKIANIKSFAQKDPSFCIPHIQNLQQITKKMYGLYPNKQFLDQINVNTRPISDQNKNFGVQVNLGKSQVDKKINLQTFRFQTRVNQYLDRFQKSIKFRKNFDSKEIQKLLQSIRELLPVQQTYNQVEINFKQELKKMLDVQQKGHQEAMQVANKKNKKLEKRISQLEKQLLQQQEKHHKQCDHMNQQSKKLQRKIQNINADYSKLMNQKSALQGSISVMIKEIQQMRSQVKKQSEDHFQVRTTFQHEQSDLKHQLKLAEQKKNQSQMNQKKQKQQIFQERNIYQQKIQLMEDHLIKERQISTGLTIQLENVTNEKELLQQQFLQLQQIHEQKMSEIDKMGENIQRISKQKTNQDALISELNQTVKNSSQKVENLQQNLKNEQIKNKQIINQNTKIAKQLDYWKDEGKLTDSDLKILRNQVDKVNGAYLDLEDQLQTAKKQISIYSEEKQNFFRQKLKLTRIVDDLQGQLHTLRIKMQAIELAERDTKDEYYQKCQQIVRETQQLQDLKKDISNARKQLYHERQERSALQKQFRQIRQELQRKREGQKTEQSKRKIELEELKVQIRRKDEQLEKQREGYQQKLSLLNHKLKQMEEWMSQKQMLSKLMQVHQTN